MSRLYPFTDRDEERPVEPNPNGERVFRVTDQTIHRRTRLVVAKSPDDATSEQGAVIAQLDAATIHEIVECVEYLPSGHRWQAPPEEV